MKKKQQWIQRVYRPEDENPKKRDFRFTTTSDLEVDPIYGPDEMADFDPAEKLGWPGEYPYTRGVQPTMYRGRLWTMRQFAGFGSARETNERFHFLLRQGQTGLSVAFDFPTLYGHDSDDPMSAGEVGRCGVAIDTLRDMEVLFNGIPLDKVTTSMTINPPAAILLCMYMAVAQKQGVSWDKIGGTIQNDMFKEYIAQKTWIFPPRPSIKIITDIIAFCSEHVPRWNTISISGYHIREAGSTAVQELAFTLADGIGYVQACVDAGLDVDSFAPRLSFFFNAHNDLFEEIAKYRAARRIWSRVMRERFGARDPRSWMLRFHTQTAGCSLAAQQPLNNIVRTTIQALAAVMGGTQSLHTNSLDETYALPTEEAVTVALRTQQIIAEESGAANIIDPLAGSYAVEALTDKLESEAMAYIERIDEMGGIIAAIESGYPQREIADAAIHYQRQLDAGIKTMVGVNKYVHDQEAPIQTLKIDPQVEREQVAALQKVRNERDAAVCDKALEELTRAARNDENIVPHILDCVRAYASEGEIIGALKPVYGEYVDPAYL
ncbi:MAG: methylmalonyl-CoA mutase family protein [Candidatus Alcyoniella australis]|nr:methylmalonyl-CoA mutase family protein [Candidatus Alcyoniella australis]